MSPSLTVQTPSDLPCRITSSHFPASLPLPHLKSSSPKIAAHPPPSSLPRKKKQKNKRSHCSLYIYPCLSLDYRMYFSFTFFLSSTTSALFIHFSPPRHHTHTCDQSPKFPYTYQSLHNFDIFPLPPSIIKGTFAGREEGRRGGRAIYKHF